MKFLDAMAATDADKAVLMAGLTDDEKAALEDSMEDGTDESAPYAEPDYAVSPGVANNDATRLAMLEKEQAEQDAAVLEEENAEQPVPEPEAEADTEAEVDAAPEVDDAAPEAEAPATLTPPDVDLAAVNKTIEDGNAAMDALLDKYNDGDLSEEEYKEQNRALARDIAKAESQIETVRAFEKQVADQWSNDAKEYVQAHGLDKGDVLQHYDTAVRTITSNPAYDHLTNAQVLALAHKSLEAQAEILGVTVPSMQAPAKAPEAKTAPAKKEQTLGDAPPTLAKVSANEAIDPANDTPFAALNRLAERDPVSFEIQFARLTSEQQDAYLQGG